MPFYIITWLVNCYPVISESVVTYIFFVHFWETFKSNFPFFMIFTSKLRIDGKILYLAFIMIAAFFNCGIN